MVKKNNQGLILYWTTLCPLAYAPIFLELELETLIIKTPQQKFVAHTVTLSGVSV